MNENRKTMEEKLNALCVRVVDYKDNDRLITLCTAEKGKILVKATGVKNPKAKLKFAASPLCFGEYIVVENKGRYTLKGCEAYDNFQDIVFDLKRYYAGFSVLEWLDKLSDNADTDTVRALLIVGTEALKELAYDVDVPPESTMLKFLNALLETTGYALNFHTSAISGKSLENDDKVCFDYYSGAVVALSERSLNYVTFTKNDIAIIQGKTTGSDAEIRRILIEISGILSFFTGVRKNYSFEEFLKL